MTTMEFASILFCIGVIAIILFDTQKQIAVSTQGLLDEIAKIRSQLDEIQYVTLKEMLREHKPDTQAEDELQRVKNIIAEFELKHSDR